MKVKIKDICPDTIFTFQGRQFKKNCMGSTTNTILEHGKTLMGKPYSGTAVTGAYPKLGGQWQDSSELQVWFNNDEMVDVN